MALIKDEDIQLVRERVRIDEVVEQYVTLRNAGGGARKGLCPFHDEKSPSFNVRPAQGFYHCFGCGAGGDSIKFLMEIEGLTFAEAVERLAAKYGIQLRYEEGGSSGPRRDPGLRQRLLESHRLAADFYAAALASSTEAQKGRDFVKDRGFGQAAAELFGMGWAPRSGDALSAHLTAKGFTADELVAGGLAGRNDRGIYDRFRGRLLWPIREISGEVIGFGARRMFDDDRIEAKYLNTSESPIYKKSQALYGIDLARRSMSSTKRAVIVEGYTDVMACHEAGVTTAVATCGTAFGDDHARLLRRILLDQEAMRGEVIFTFDGDEAGQRAAMKAFNGDAAFAAQTYVAVEKRGMDPCDLRLAEGDAAVRALVDSRVPLYRFVLDNTLARYDLDRGDQRVDAIREAVGLASSIRDRSKLDEFLREIAGRVGVQPEQVQAEFRRLASSGDKRATTSRPSAAAAVSPETSPQASPVPSFGAQAYFDEREALKAIVQYPHLAGPLADSLDEDAFTHPVARQLWSVIKRAGLPTKPEPGWLPTLAAELPDDGLRQLLEVAAVDPLRASERAMDAVVAAVVVRLQERAVARRIADVKSRLQRSNAPESQDDPVLLLSRLLELEQQRRDLRERIIAATG